jgi:hypothetical protein
MAGSQPASLRVAMSLKPQTARHRSSSARNDFKKWVKLSAPRSAEALQRLKCSLALNLGTRNARLL